MDGMIYDPTKPVEMFNDLVSDKIQSELAGAIVRQYKKAHEYCYGNLPLPEAHDLLPHLRRAYIEGEISDFVEKVEGYKTRTKKNKAENCCHRSILGDRIRLTQSKVEQRRILPRNAEFRKGYAKFSQMVFDFMDQDKVSEMENEAYLYAIIVHMPTIDDSRVPEFVDIIFPDEDYKMILGRIELLNKFSDIVPIVSQEDTIPDKAEIKLERSIKRTDSEIA